MFKLIASLFILWLHFTRIWIKKFLTFSSPPANKTSTDFKFPRSDYAKEKKNFDFMLFSLELFVVYFTFDYFHAKSFFWRSWSLNQSCSNQCKLNAVSASFFPFWATFSAITWIVCTFPDCLFVQSFSWGVYVYVLFFLILFPSIFFWPNIMLSFTFD